MNNFYEELKKYFEETPQDIIMKDWAKSIEFDNTGISVEGFLKNSQQYHSIFTDHSPDNHTQNQLNKFHTEFPSLFLTNKFSVLRRNAI
jgi:hypothetical protein